MRIDVFFPLMHINYGNQTFCSDIPFQVSWHLLFYDNTTAAAQATREREREGGRLREREKKEQADYLQNENK